MSERPIIRVGTDDDSWEVIALVAACWSEYPGCVMDVHGECPDLLAPSTACRSAGGELWVATDRCGTVVATVGWTMVGPATAELERLYVARHWRRRGLAGELTTLAEGAARATGATRMELWSDTRFADAHRFYERRGYERAGPDRSLGDLSHTREHHYARLLR